MAAEVDFILVGQGLAGSALAMALIQRGCSVLVIDRADAYSATRMAAGLVTPLAGKGMNASWRQEVYLPRALEYYRALERRTGERVFHAMPVLRLFSDAKEAAKFERKKEQVSAWIENASADVDAAQLHADFGGFVMRSGGRLDTAEYLRVVRGEIEKSGQYLEADFCEKELTYSENKVSWREFSARKVLLCQGFAGLGNGAFAEVPHRSAKGEMLTVRIPELDSSQILSRNGWLVPLKDGLWRAGATYEWGELNTEPTAKGLAYVEQKVADFTSCAFETLKHEAGVRPIVERSQPVIGLHAEIPQLGFFNGLGSKGVITAPSVGEHFAAFLCGECELDPELSLARF